ncbi:MAG: hypothetical protein GY804_03825 [Alphaproteobacteria bacterium]|nr:hypothetical protein [Alphaproteobacteria bacterium]
MNTYKKITLPKIARAIQEQQPLPVDGRYHFKIDTFKVSCKATVEAKNALIARFNKGCHTGTFTAPRKISANRVYCSSTAKEFMLSGETANAIQYLENFDKPIIFQHNSNQLLVDMVDAKIKEWPQLFIAKPASKDYLGEWGVYAPNGQRLSSGKNKAEALVNALGPLLKQANKIILQDALKQPVNNTMQHQSV